jgi:YidC/Oxa1 family membrane protein insertase
MQTLISFIIESLSVLYDVTGDLGLAIIVFTVLIRTIMLPITLPSLRASEKMRALQPEVKKLKEKHGKDKQALQLAQVELYKKYNINPLAGCLPQILQIGVLILLYQALISFLKLTEIHGVQMDPQFLWLNLTLPDHLYIFPVLAAVTQLILSLMIIPATETRDIVPNKSSKKSVQEANKKEEDLAEMAASIQQQMLYVMPVMTGFIALTFPSGLALYWIMTTVFSIGQQVYISGWGGLPVYWNRFAAKVGIRN